MNVIRTDSELKIRSEYHPDLPKRARKIGGKWEACSKLWVFDIRDENRVAELYKSIYGYWDTDGEPPSDAVTVRITANSNIDALRSGVFLLGDWL